MDMLAIQSLVGKKKYRLTSHAENERDADKITLEEIKDAFLSLKAEIIEDYPNDPRGPSCLILGFTKYNRPAHIVCGMEGLGLLVVITVYRPDQNEWFDWKIRSGR